jgi:hypothetical protein
MTLLVKEKIINIMKTKIIALLFLFIIKQSNAQSERVTIGIYTEPQHYSRQVWNEADGFNIGAHIELQEPFFYIRARAFSFPGLNDIPYFDFDGGVGTHYRDPSDRVRFFAGGFIGLINREGWGHMKSGWEVGWEYYFDEGIYIGIKGDYQYKHDDKIWRKVDSGHEVWSVGITIGYSWVL